MHKTLKNAELLKHSKLDKNAPTCFGLHINHLQGAKVSALCNLLSTVYLHTVHDTHALQGKSDFIPLLSNLLFILIFIQILHTYPLLQSQYAAIALTTPCTSFTQILLTKRVIFSQALTLAP